MPRARVAGLDLNPEPGLNPGSGRPMLAALCRAPSTDDVAPGRAIDGGGRHPYSVTLRLSATGKAEQYKVVTLPDGTDTANVQAQLIDRETAQPLATAENGGTMSVTVSASSTTLMYCAP